MKKIVSVLMVAVALMMAAPAQAQLIKFGVKGGMNFAELDTGVKSWVDAKESSTGFLLVRWLKLRFLFLVWEWMVL